MSWERNNSDAKYEAIQESNFVPDFIEDEEDFFGFAKAIEIDHLTDEEVDEVFDMFGDK